MLAYQIIITSAVVFHHQQNYQFLIIMNLIQQFCNKKLKRLNLNKMLSFIILFQISKNNKSNYIQSISKMVYQSWLFAPQKYFSALFFFHTTLSKRNKLIWNIDNDLQFIYHSLKLNISDVHLKHLHIASYYIRQE
jgi:hypothetical protein